MIFDLIRGSFLLPMSRRFRLWWWKTYHHIAATVFIPVTLVHILIILEEIHERLIELKER